MAVAEGSALHKSSNAALLELYDDGTYEKRDASWFSQSQESMQRRTDAIPRGGNV